MDHSKPQMSPHYQEFEPRVDMGYQRSVRVARTVESARLALTTLALCAGAAIVGISADTLSVYNSTNFGAAHFLSLWPREFDLRPTIAMVITGAIILASSAISLVVSKLPPIRNNPLIHTSVSYLIPAVCLVASLIGMSFFYGVNASDTVYSLQAWSCQWSSIDMNIKPHWGTLCKESKAALYLMVMIVPLEVLVLATAAWGSFQEKKQVIVRERKGSPAMS